MVLDSEYVYKGITEWSERWRCHGWREKTKAIGHRDLWELIWDLQQLVGWQVKVVWTPSYLNVRGNDKADELAKQGWFQHPHNNKRRSEEPEGGCMWAHLSLGPMRSDVSSSRGRSGSDEPSQPQWLGLCNPSVSSVPLSALGVLSKGSTSSSSVSSVVSGTSPNVSTGVSDEQRRRRRRAGDRDNQVSRAPNGAVTTNPTGREGSYTGCARTCDGGFAAIAGTVGAASPCLDNTWPRLRHVCVP